MSNGIKITTRKSTFTGPGFDGAKVKPYKQPVPRKTTITKITK